MSVASQRSDFPDWLPLVSVAAGFLVLSIPPVVLFGLAVLGAVRFAGTLALGGVLVVITVVLGVAMRNEWYFLEPATRFVRSDPRDAVADGAAIVAGTVLALAGSAELGLSPVVAAGVVGVLSAVVVPDRSVPAYCGAFVGMTSPTLFTTYWRAGVAALVAAAVYVVAYPVFRGVGGKLGTTAFVGTTLTVAATGGTFQSGPLPGLRTILFVVGYALAGAVATFAFQTRLDQSAVLASGVVGSIGGLTIPVVHAGGAGMFSAGLFAASFAGMSDPRRIPNSAWIGLTGLLVGVVVVYTQPFLGGSGGKLGTIAFGASLAVHAVLQELRVVRLRRRFDEYPRRETT